MVTIPLCLLFRALSKEFPHLGWCAGFHCGFVSIFSNLAAVKFFVLTELQLALHHAVLFPIIFTFPTSEWSTWEKRYPKSNIREAPKAGPLV